MNLHNDFIERHIGPNKKDTANMLKTLNMNNIDELINQTIPQNIKLNRDLNLPPSMSEPRYLEHIKKLGEKNKNYRSYIGLGYYNTILPSVI